MKRIALSLLALMSICVAALAQTAAVTVNGSITIATGNTFQQVLPALATGTSRRSITIQNNNSNTDSCWLFIGATASATKATSILLAPGQAYTRYYPYLPSDNIAATCTTTSDTLYVDTQ
jgi:hypothetical protein